MDKAKPHIILIAYYFPPGQEIGGFRPYRFYKYLKRMGYACHVITASVQPNDVSEDVFFLPDNLRDVWESERLPFRAYWELLIRKAMFPGQVGLLWSFKVAAKVRRIVRNHPGSNFVVFTTHPPLGVFLAGLFSPLNSRVWWMADFRDPLAGLMFNDVPDRTRFWNRVLEKRIFRKARAIVANAEGAAVPWRERYPWAKDKLHVICNGFDPEDIPHARELPARPGKIILHAGALYNGRNPNIIIASLARLRVSAATEVASVRIVLLGWIDHKAGVDPALFKPAQQEGWLEVRNAVPKAESQRAMEEADGLLLIQPQSDVQVPGKLFEYICIGRPILALVPRSSPIEQILDRSGIPHVCVYADDVPDTVDRKLLDFLRLPTAPARHSAWFEENFNAAAQAEQLAAIIDNIETT